MSEPQDIDPTAPAEAAPADAAPDARVDLSAEVARKFDPDRLMKLLASRAGKGQALDATLRARYERKLGVDLGHVRVVTGPFAEEFNRQRDAHAVTVGGTGVILMGGSPDRSMATAAGQALLAHELAHVAQAKRGLFRAARVEGMPFAEEHGDDHADAEHDAERFEAEELAAHSGQGEGGPAASPAEQAAARERRDQRIIARALELLAESGRLDELRNGERFPR